jgi:hypothetical protein
MILTHGTSNSRADVASWDFAPRFLGRLHPDVNVFRLEQGLREK